MDNFVHDFQCGLVQTAVQTAGHKLTSQRLCKLGLTLALKLYNFRVTFGKFSEISCDELCDELLKMDYGTASWIWIVRNSMVYLTILVILELF